MVSSTTAAGTISHRSWFFKFLHHVRERGGADRLFLDEFVHRLWRPVEHHAAMTLADEPPHHVGPHPSKTDHADLHNNLLPSWLVPYRPVPSICWRRSLAPLPRHFL